MTETVKDQKHHCPTCGQATMKHKHLFNKALAEILLICVRSRGLGQPFHLQHDLKLTAFQYNNFQKLRYWGFAAKHFENGVRKGGYWTLTNDVFDFLHGDQVQRHVWTFNNEIVERSRETITLREAAGSYEVPETWARRAEPVVKPNAEQLRLELAS